MKPSGPGLLFAWSVFITDSISLLLLVFSYFIFLSDSYLKYCIYLGFCSFLLGLPSYLHTIVQSNFLWYFCIHLVSVIASPSSFVIIFIWALYLFALMSLANILSISFIISKNHPLVSLISFSILFFLLVFISALVGESSPDMTSCRLQGVLKLFSTHWCMGPDPEVTGWGAQSVPELVLSCWWVEMVPKGFQGWFHPLVVAVRSWS